MALELFCPEVQAWFAAQVGTPTPVQEEAWPAIASGAHTLISAPTGTGKTLAAFLGLIDAMFRQHREGGLPQGLQVLYISPLKSLAADIRENLRRPLEGLGFDAVQVAVRTGDTDAGERQRMLRRPPHILITTPESLFLLLTSQGGRRMLSTLRTVILDELHVLIGSKRGAHLMLSLARLDRLCGRSVQRVGLSATLRPLERAARYLAPMGEEAVVAAPPMEKERQLRVEGLLPDMRVLPQGTIWPDLARRVLEHCLRVRTVIAFLEGRGQAEKLAYEVNALAGEGFARTHHGCVSKEQRRQAEEALRSGSLRLLCATSSMELGIDVGEVDLVLQIGPPATVSGALQRLGRAGHNPGRVSVMRIFPKTAAEGVTCGLTASCAMDGILEPARPPMNCLDILAQHLVSMAVEGCWTVEDAVALVRRCYSFSGITAEDVEAVLRMLSGDWEHDREQPARPRLDYDRIHGTFAGDAYSRMLAVSSGGTIPDRGWYAVMLADGTRLGELDEEFVFEARMGDRFLLGSFAWAITEFGHDRVVVAPASSAGARPPFWRGDAQGRAYAVGRAFGERLRRLEEAAQRQEALEPGLQALLLDDWAAENAARYLQEQRAAVGCLPDDRTIILEHFSDEAGEHQLMVHSVFGRQVNSALALLLEQAARQVTGLDVRSYEDDDGFLLYLMGDREIPDGLFSLVEGERAEALLRALLPGTPLFAMAFRYNAARALMMGVRRGRRAPLWVQRLRGAEALGEAVEHPEHPLMRETLRECMEQYIDMEAVRDVLGRIAAGSIRLLELHGEKPSPMALPMRRQVEAYETYNYHPIPDAARRTVERALSVQAGIAPDREQLEAAAGALPSIRTPQELHAYLMIHGDMAAGEAGAPLECLQALAEDGRALYVEPGLWIAAEEASLYAEALENRDPAAFSRIVRRCLRYQGAQDAQSLETRYQLPQAFCQRVLEDLEAEGKAVLYQGAYYHAQVFSRAQRWTLAQRRRDTVTLPMERYAAMMAHRTRFPGSPAQQTAQAVMSLLGEAYPARQWEEILLPARVAGYRPALLDAFLAQGEVSWRMEGEEKPLLRMDRYEDMDWENAPEGDRGALTPAQAKVLTALERRGASFAAALAPLLPGENVTETLLALARQGWVHADSFVPVRHILNGSQDKAAARRRAGARAQVRQAGRWEMARPLTPRSWEERLQAALDRARILCRETAGELPWREALELLRIWEYTGRVRRGYYIQGLSGAQFIRAEDWEGVRLALEQPGEDTLWLHAADPAQAWGRVLPHREGASFLLLPTTAVALQGGRPTAVLERGGETLRVLEEAALPDALAALVRDYAQGRVYAWLNHLTVKTYPAPAAPALEAAGFARQMDDYVLWRPVN